MNAEPQCVLQTAAGEAIPLKGVSARGRLNGLLFELTVEQTYRNHGQDNMEAEYTFPVPHRAVLLGLELQIGDRALEAVAVRKPQAREQYERAMDQGDSAALLEQAGDGLWTLSLGNLLAGEEARIRYRYAEVLDRKGDEVRLAIPTVIAPRYGSPASGGLQPHQAPETDLLADYPFELQVDIHGAMAGAAIRSPSHAVQVSATGGGKRITLGQGARLDRDFILSLSGPVTRSAALVAADPLAGADPQEPGYVTCVSLDPGLTEDAGAPLALKLLVDCSGSMAGDSIACARRALLGVLDRLQPGDRVSLTRFGSNVVHETKGLVHTTAAGLAELRHTLGNLQANLGGTEMQAALEAAIAIKAPDARVKDILLITDGEIWSVPALLDEAARSGHRIFVVAVGAAPAEALAQGLGARTRGACEFVSPNEDTEAAILRMFGRLREAPKRIAGVRWPAEPAWQGPLPPAVFSGDTLHLLAGFQQLPAGEVVVTVEGGRTGSRELRVPLGPPLPAGAEADLLPRVAAARRLAQLPADEAAGLAERYQLASAHTSLVVVQARSAEEKAQGLPVLAQVPQMLAAGWGGAGDVRLLARASLSASEVVERLRIPEAPALADHDWSASSSSEFRYPRAPDDLYIREVLPPGVLLETVLGQRERPVESHLPETLLEDLGKIAGRSGRPLEEVLRVFVALLAASPAGAGLTPEQRSALTGAVLGERDYRELRQLLAPLVAGITPDLWGRYETGNTVTILIG